jgi:hypothetical protein
MNTAVLVAVDQGKVHEMWYPGLQEMEVELKIARAAQAQFEKEDKNGKRKAEIDQRTTPGTNIPDCYYCHFGNCSIDNGPIFSREIRGNTSDRVTSGARLFSKRRFGLAGAAHGRVFNG